jgi:hypothetical protein
MSSLYSDPPFPRGTTLLNGDTIETDALGPVAGRSIVGQIKVFQDVNTNTKGMHSNRLVTCVAARYKGSDVADVNTAGSEITGKLYVFDATTAGNVAALENFSALGTSSNITNASIQFGVLDEYLTGPLRTNDIVWLVVNGPTSIRQSAAIIGANAAVAPATSGNVAAWASGVSIGQNIGLATTAALQLTRVMLNSPAIA